MLKDLAKIKSRSRQSVWYNWVRQQQVLKKWTDGVLWGRLSGWEEPSMVKRSLQGPRIPPPLYKNSRLNRTHLDWLIEMSNSYTSPELRIHIRGEVSQLISQNSTMRGWLIFVHNTNWMIVVYLTKTWHRYELSFSPLPSLLCKSSSLLEIKASPPWQRPGWSISVPLWVAGQVIKVSSKTSDRHFSQPHTLSQIRHRKFISN